MLFKTKHLEGIMSGEISLAFRRWDRPSVKEGNLIRTSIGVIQVTGISECDIADITEEGARQAGFYDLKSLIDRLTKSTGNHIYRINIRYYSEDPRLEIRNQTALTQEQLQLLRNKIERLDKFSKQGQWTLSILKAIRDHPGVRAADLATKTGKEKEWLKLNIRKLKDLGLTISHEPGYTLSPLGIYYLERSI